MIILIPLAACGNGQTFTRAALDGERVYWGDSITNFCGEYTNGLNRAWPGDTTTQLLELVEYYKGDDAPARHHVLIGINDIYFGIGDTYAARLNVIIGFLQGEVTVTSILPTREAHINEQVKVLNAQAREIAEHWGHAYRDIYNDFVGPDGLLNEEYAADKVHLTNAGCEKLFEGQ